MQRSRGQRGTSSNRALKEGSGLGLQRGPQVGAGKKPPERAPCPWLPGPALRGLQRRPGLARLQQAETREGPGRSAGPKGAVMGCGAGVGWVRPGPSPVALKTTPVYLGAGRETYGLPLLPPQAVGLGRERAWDQDPCRVSSRWGQCPGRGLVAFPAVGVGGLPSPPPRAQGKRVPGAGRAPSPHRHTPI